MMQTHEMHSCITACWESRTVCIDTLFNHCLQQGGKHVVPEHIKVMMDCIQACQVAADFMTRGSSLHMVECSACAEVCDACADSCEKIGGEVMLACAKACRLCAESCRAMGKVKKAA